MFGKKTWGPQPISMAFASIGGAGIGLGVAKDTGVKSYADLKGKRIAWVRGAPALNQNAASFLAYGGLTWNDVKKVEFGGWTRTRSTASSTARSTPASCRRSRRTPSASRPRRAA